MHQVIRSVSALALSLGLAAAPCAALAAPTDTTVGGKTSVVLLPSFLSALQNLGVTPGAVGPGQLHSNYGGHEADFPITTGAVDLGTTTGEIDHAGGLSLSAGSNRVVLSAFAIDISKPNPVLTGIVEVNGSFRGRMTLFDLSLSSAQINLHDDLLSISGVGLKLDIEAANALSGVFGATVPELPVGTARVSAVLCDEDRF